MTAAELVASKKHILLDFDGPICAAFAGYGAANISRQLATLMSMSGVAVPPGLYGDADPFQLLRFAAGLDEPVLEEIDSEFRRLEVQAVRLAPPTAHALDVISTLHAAGHDIVVVSNNSIEAVEIYLRMRGLARMIAGVSARTNSDPSLLKPNPHLILDALTKSQASKTNAVMIGDSVSDITAAHEAEVQAIALANRPGKWAALAQAQPSSIIDSMSELIGS